jgi:hypothetical protein
LSPFSRLPSGRSSAERPCGLQRPTARDPRAFTLSATGRPAARSHSSGATAELRIRDDQRAAAAELRLPLGLRRSRLVRLRNQLVRGRLTRPRRGPRRQRGVARLRRRPRHLLLQRRRKVDDSRSRGVVSAQQVGRLSVRISPSFLSPSRAVQGRCVRNAAARTAAASRSTTRPRPAARRDTSDGHDRAREPPGGLGGYRRRVRG